MRPGHKISMQGFAEEAAESDDDTQTAKFGFELHVEGMDQRAE